MTWFLVATGAVAALGAGAAVGARRGHAAALGALVALVFTPFVADPLPAPAVLAFRIVAGVLAAFLLLVAGRRAAGEPPPLGFPAMVAAGAAAFAAGLGATAVGLPAFGPPAALAAGLAAIVVAIPPIALARDPFRLGVGLVVLADAALLLRAGLLGTPPALEALLSGAVLVALAATAVVLVATAATAAGEPTGRAATPARRRPPA